MGDEFANIFMKEKSCVKQNEITTEAELYTRRTFNQDEAIPGGFLEIEKEQNPVQHLDNGGWEQKHTVQKVSSGSQKDIKMEKYPEQNYGQNEEYNKLNEEQVQIDGKKEFYSGTCNCSKQSIL